MQSDAKEGAVVMRIFSLLVALLSLGACASPPGRAPLPLAERVDLPRFMGDWYVIANIPTFIEKGAHNAVESYRLDADGTIATTFTFNQDAFDGKRKEYQPRGFIVDRQTNAIWGMRFVWPIKADYRIVHVDRGYTETIIGREARDYVWIMARSPTLSAEAYCRLRRQVGDAGYDLGKLQQVPQREARPAIACP
jgi:apolipoprotein D and lipocalin family protein